MTTTLPHRFNEKSFRRYETIIAQVVRVFPKPLPINPADLDLAAETVRGRLRDAMTSLAENNWLTKVDLVLFNQIHSKIVVSLRSDGMVVVGDKDTVKETTNEVFPCIDPTEVVDMTQHPFQHRGELRTLCFLAHSQVLKKRIRLHLSMSEVDTFMQDYDIGLAEQPDGSYLLS